jgi:MOSC domain-containing protein YiiM
MKVDGRIFQINLSDGGVPKLACPQADIGVLGLVGDRQIHTEFHGGPERAVCLFSLERILALQEEGHPVFPGAMGENLTLVGVDWSLIESGVRLKIGGQLLLEVTRFAIPCSALRPYFTDGAILRVSQEHNPGWSRAYTRVITPGSIRVGDKVSIVT